MKIYIAGSSQEMDLVSHYMKKVEELGHTITWDWCKEIKSIGIADPVDVTEKDRQKWSTEDLKGVSIANIIWLLIPDTGGKGCWVEFGYAFAIRRFFNPTIIVASANSSIKSKTTIFTSLADYLFSNHEEAFDWITKRERI